MTAQSMKTWFEGHPTLSKLYEGIEQTKALERDLAALLPAYLMPYLAVGLIREGKLTIFVAHGAQAARLRHLAPTVLEALYRRGWAVDSLRIRVRLPTNQEHSSLGSLFYASSASRPAHQKEACLTPTAWEHLQNCSAQLDASPLKQALAAMVERHRALSSTDISQTQK